MIELKPCPFCGSEVKLVRRNRYGNISYVIVCQNDSCFMKESHNRPSFKKVDEAIESWNKRYEG